MNAPYPEGFFTWDEDRRNAYFAKVAAAYRGKHCRRGRAPEIRPAQGFQTRTSHRRR